MFSRHNPFGAAGGQLLGAWRAQLDLHALSVCSHCLQSPCSRKFWKLLMSEKAVENVLAQGSGPSAVMWQHCQARHLNCSPRNFMQFQPGAGASPGCAGAEGGCVGSVVQSMSFSVRDGCLKTWKAEEFTQELQQPVSSQAPRGV